MCIIYFLFYSSIETYTLYYQIYTFNFQLVTYVNYTYNFINDFKSFN